ncbi:MAG: hypothetical protein DDT34_00759 [Firmicutes bacterium]|nr:hypothetical protein [Bacillota bacterium]MBT9151985.1 hypothetical protein [Bacillota bacterium]MBT9157287.1 hypothetical protein [Bacillota bacterium]
MQRQLIAFQAVLFRNVIELKRYAFNTISMLVSLYVMFMILFFGLQRLGGAALAAGDTLEGLLVGYLLWTMAIMAYSELSWDLNAQAQVGTLEQLYISPIGFGRLNAYSLLCNLVLQFGYAAIILAVLMVSTGKYLHVDLVSIVPLFIVTLMSAYGVGFAVGGLALIYKRIQAFFSIFQFVFLAFLTLPWAQFPWARFLPLSMGNALLREVMIHGRRIWELDPTHLMVLVGTGVFYLALGIMAFAWSERIARDKGLLGHY